jgi:hypothetical protein
MADGCWLLAEGKAQTTAGVFSMALRTADASERPLADVGQKAVLAFKQHHNTIARKAIRLAAKTSAGQRAGNSAAELQSRTDGY